ncbi:folliculin-interacting protein 2 isoform X2 [Trichoplusia ni]|uniref:Folliculin-interacting protein 2 isoform X2 n=1 Tax=Trichoplusia ni TaxID=7111 RepID=A0A7E5WGC6_TRINI|nr:folliculin-interacting protein 2 isoform X2 [Trichoplusia ni]
MFTYYLHEMSCQINPEQVRLLLFKECDWRGRKLLFDSAAIQKVPAGKNDKPCARPSDEVPCIVEVSDGFKYLYKGPAADANVLGEMIFGAVAMNYKSVSLKIHIMDEPRRLMCTKVFCVPSRRITRVVNPERKDASGCEAGDRSKPLSVPLVREEGVSLSFSLDRGDSGYYGDYSPYSSVGSTNDYFSMCDIWESNNQEEFCSFHLPPGRKLSSSSNGSWQRRTFQNMATRFDLGHQSTNLLGVPARNSNVAGSDSQLYRSSTTSGTSDSISSTGSAMVHRKNKLGLALLISAADSAQIDVVRRCLEHSPQLQTLVCRLRLATLTAGATGGRVSTLYRAAEHAARWLSDLVYGPRLQPMWLNLVTGDSRSSNKLAESLLSDLCSVLTLGDTKSTNFFISTLLTHVLTYHLGWVATVSPYDTVDHQARPQDTAPDSCKPYNALWAQLNDLCGSIGFPPRTARTIITGTKNTQFLNKLLVVLTYFLRCGDVRRNEFHYQSTKLQESKVVSVTPESATLKRTATHVNKLAQCETESLTVPSVNTQNSDSSVSTLAASEVSIKRSSTLANLGQKLSNSTEFLAKDCSSTSDLLVTNQLKRNPTMILSLKPSSDSSLNSSLSENETEEQKVVFVLGDNDKLVGLKNKSAGGKCVKKSSKVNNEPLNLETPEVTTDSCTKEGCEKDKRADSPSKCCGQTLQHSKPIKHSGFKFEFDKYPQIVTNYMKSKNLEILDRHYIGKPGNLKLDNFQFDPTIVPPIQEERCETCVKCQMMESMLQTPTNASEMEYMNDIPRQSEPQYAKATVVEEVAPHREMSPKTFVRRQEENTVVVNVKECEEVKRPEDRRVGRRKEKDRVVEVKQVCEFPTGELQPAHAQPRSGFDGSLLGALTDHYVPDLILQGTIAKPNAWESELRRDLDLTSYLSKTTDSTVQAVAIIGDINNWQVRVVGGQSGSGGMSSLVGAMLDTLPAMFRARVPAQLCISFLEGKLREFCVLSKTLADMLMSTDFCDIATLTKSLNIDVNDVPLLLAVATTHTPQVATRYGLSYG